MKTIEIRRYKGKKPLQTVVDDDVYLWANKNRWHISKYGYVMRWSKSKNGRRKSIYLHREICKNPKGMVIDHISGDKLDNTANNLRVCTIRQNIINSHKRKNNTSGKVGVSRKRGGWRAYLMLHRKQISLGTYDNLKDAIMARKRGEKKYFGEYAPCI